MLLLVVGVVAALFVGVVVGFGLRGRELGSAQREIQRLQQESAMRAGFEAVAAERAATIGRLAEEIGELRGEMQTKLDAESRLMARASELEAELRAQRESLAEKIALLDEAKKSLANQFQALAADILDKKSKTFSESSEKQLGDLLNPLREQIKDFRTKVEESQKENLVGRTQLAAELKSLKGLNEQLSDEARNLTTALRGSSKAQGDWGEFILRDLLEKAGLRQGEQYSFQESFTGIEDGDRTRTARTDVILYLPGGRNLVIDSKVSLTAYTDYAGAATDVERSAALKLHLASVRGHVVNLSKSGYHRLPGIEAPDFVVLFVPVEPAFLLALQNDASLWADAYERGILLVGPTTLLYVIRIVNVLWQQELQSKNVKDVMDRGAELYDKFVGFVADLESVGKSLRAADFSYGLAMKKLTEGRGNLVRQVEMLKELGVKTTKSLPVKLLEAADSEDTPLALAAEAEEGD
jgi:DNA recombination protein RmuC